MLLADRPTTSRWALLLRGQTLLIKSGRSSKARTEADTSSERHPLPGSQIAFEPDLGSAFDPTRTVAREGIEESTPGSLLAHCDRQHDPKTGLASVFTYAGTPERSLGSAALLVAMSRSEPISAKRPLAVRKRGLRFFRPTAELAYTR